jgi:hypothetical protein
VDRATADIAPRELEEVVALAAPTGRPGKAVAARSLATMGRPVNGSAVAVLAEPDPPCGAACVEYRLLPSGGGVNVFVTAFPLARQT